MDRDLSIIAQNAGSTAAAIYANFAGPEFDVTLYNSIRQAVFDGTKVLAEGGNLAAATVARHFDSTDAVAAVEEIRESASASRPNEDVEINFGKHRGKTIGAIYDSGKDGKEYIEWLGEKSNNDFIKSRVRQFLAAA